MMARQRLPNRRPSLTVPASWQGQNFTVTVGFDPETGLPREVFAGEAKGAMLATVSDACVALSIGMQSGASPEDLMRSMGQTADWVLRNGEMVEAMVPASPIGAILEAVVSVARNDRGNTLPDENLTFDEHMRRRYGQDVPAAASDSPVEIVSNAKSDPSATHA
jgi:hypothetical protein